MAKKYIEIFKCPKYDNLKKRINKDQNKNIRYFDNNPQCVMKKHYCRPCIFYGICNVMINTDEKITPEMMDNAMEYFIKHYRKMKRKAKKENSK